MHTARSANRAAMPSRSTVETTTTVSIPRIRQARTTRTAISPRLATSTRRIGLGTTGPGATAAGLAIGGPDPEQHLLVLDHLGVGRADLHNLPCRGGDNRVHQLHDLDDRELLVLRDPLPDLHERRLARARRDPERADGRRLHR